MNKVKIDVYIYGDENTPSSRLRWINYKDYFKNDNIEYNIVKLNKYFKKGIIKKIPNKANYIILQKLPVSRIVLKILKRRAEKVIFDIDDAIWMNHSINSSDKSLKRIIELNKLKLTLKNVDKVIVSNKFIESYIKKYNYNTIIIPTSPSDAELNCKNYNRKESCIEDKFIVGWTGSKENIEYIRIIEPFIKNFFKEKEDAYLMIISNDDYISDDTEFNKKIINIKWSLENENYYLNKFNVGIMPSALDEWALGKCAYKLIYYMRKKIPTISTKWGYQTEFIRNDFNGFIIDNDISWEKALNKIYFREININKLTLNAYRTYKKYFSKDVIYEKYKEIFIK